MRYPAGSLDEQILETIEAPSNDARALVPFTGYYSINTAAGAFFSIDTIEVYTNSLSYPIINISVSFDGKTSTSYDFAGSGASFDGHTLIIPKVLQVGLHRGYDGGRLVQVSGTILGRPVTGFTSFNPVELPVFVGTYKNVETRLDKLIVGQSSLKFDFGDGRGLQDIPAFTYSPAMYVVQFASAGVTYTLMLGTAAQKGLACFITDGKNPNLFAVTIL